MKGRGREGKKCWQEDGLDWAGLSMVVWWRERKAVEAAALVVSTGRWKEVCRHSICICIGFMRHTPGLVSFCELHVPNSVRPGLSALHWPFSVFQLSSQSSTRAWPLIVAALVAPPSRAPRHRHKHVWHSHTFNPHLPSRIPTRTDLESEPD